MTGGRRKLIAHIYERLHEAFGPQKWWPAEGPFEMIVGAILTQNTAWKNVVRSIDNLRREGLLGLRPLAEMPQADLASLIRSSGYYNQKARKLKTFCGYVLERWQGDLRCFLSLEIEPLRHELLQLHGIGPETADSIILYAAFKPSFVVDAYTYRIFSRHNWVSENLGYEELQSYFMDCLEPDVGFFQELHALLVRTGHLYCRRAPRCEGCPLNERTEDN